MMAWDGNQKKEIITQLQEMIQNYTKLLMKMKLLFSLTIQMKRNLQNHTNGVKNNFLKILEKDEFMFLISFLKCKRSIDANVLRIKNRFNVFYTLLAPVRFINNKIKYNEKV